MKTRLETVSEQYSDFIVETQYRALSVNIINTAKLCLVDFLGVTMGGVSTQEARITRDVMLAENGKVRNAGNATVIGSRAKVGCLPASFCNSVAGHALELDDTHREAIIHAGAAVIPTALAISEMVKASGKDLLVSMIVGYEIAIRVALQSVLLQRERGFHVTGTCGVFGAAATAGKLLDLNRNQMVNALGLAGTQASGLTEFLTNGDMSKRLNPARAANGGIVSALLAQKGFTGPRTIFEGANGFWKAYANSIRPHDTVEGLGGSFEIERVGFKPYACCRYLHTSIESALKLRDSIPDPDEIGSIFVRTHKLAANKNLNPVNIVSAQFSIQYGISVALIDGKATISEFSEERIHSSDVQNLSRKVKTIADPELETAFPRKWTSIVSIKLKSGQILEERIDIPKGEPENPITEEDAKQKFMSLSRLVFSTKQAEQVYSTVKKLDNLSSIDVLTELLQANDE